MDGPRIRPGEVLLGLLASVFAAALGLACGGQDQVDARARIDLLADVSRVQIEARPREVPVGLRVLSSEQGLATVLLPLRAEAGRLENTLEQTGGRLFDMHRWELPWPVAPELLCAARPPALAGLALPRMSGPGDVGETGDGVWYVGDDGAGAHCLRVALPRDADLPETLELTYPVLGVELLGTGLEPASHPARLASAPRVRGEATARSLVVPAGTRVLWPLPSGAEGRRLAGRFSATGGALSLRSTVGERETSPLELGPGAEHAFDFEAGAGLWSLEVEGPEGALLWIEQPALTRPRRGGDPPNVVFVLIDTLRGDRFTAPLMPALSELAEEAIVFKDCWATCSWTLPSVSTLFTGAHGGGHQAWLNNRELGDGIDTLAEVFSRVGYSTAAFTGGVFVDQSFGLDRGFDTFDSSAGGAAAVFGRAEEWLASAGTGPWFLFVHTYEVHAPYEPPVDVAERVLAAHPGVLAGRPAEPQAFFSSDGVIDGDPARIGALLSDLYDAEVTYTDGVLGRFLATLRGAGLLDEAVLAVTSDHGEEFGEHGLFGHTDTLYSETLHVPLVLHLPGGARSGTSDERPVSQIDFAPTLLDAARLSSHTPSTFAGRSLLDSAEVSPIYATRNIEEVGILRALRTEGHALIRGPYIYPRAAEGPELYDLSHDPMQLENVHGTDPRTAEVEARFAVLSAQYDRPLVQARVLESARLERELEAMGYKDR